MCLYEVSYIIVQYGNAWQDQPPNYLGYCDKVVHVVTKPATSLSEQFNWSHVIKTTNEARTLLCCVDFEVESARTLQSLLRQLYWLG